MPFNIDPDLPVPLGIQLRGVIEYGIACGQLPPGLRLPPVRAMAQRLGIAPMTVSQVYKELKATGLLETKPGHGTFINASVPAQVRPQILELQRRVDQLVDDAVTAGLGGPEIVALVNARINRRNLPPRNLRLVFVGLFEEATRAYGVDIQARLPSGDTIQTTTLSEIAGNDLARQRAINADLVVTLQNRRAEVLEIVGQKKPVLGISYIPSERTRTMLAQIDPLARVGIVSTFPEFLPIMKAGVQRFAPHVLDIHATVLESPELGEVLRRVDVVVYATGSESVVATLRPNMQSFEYRHTPDPREIDQILLPMLEGIRGILASSPAGDSPAGLRRAHEN
ncbi:MAG: GntR family transcriptional regulator [Dongiaceae bacterium]